MKINDLTIQEIAQHGDKSRILRILKFLVRRIRATETERKSGEETATKLRTAYIGTETDRDRLRRMVLDLMSLSEQQGYGDEAKKIVESRGGLVDSPFGSNPSAPGKN